MRQNLGFKDILLFDIIRRVFTTLGEMGELFFKSLHYKSLYKRGT